MKFPDPEMPDFLRRFPLDPEREAAIAASWSKRGDGIRRHQYSVEDDLQKGVVMASLVRVTLTDNAIPRLGDGQREVKCLAIGEKWARFDAGPPHGTFTVRRSEWDGWKKETIVTNIDSAQTETQAQATAPPARKKREAAPAAKAPKKAAGKAKEATKAKPAEGHAMSKKDMLWALLKAQMGKPVSYADACKEVYGEADVPAIGGVVIGCTIRATEQGLVLEKGGKGKDATFTLRRKRKGDA